MAHVLNDDQIVNILNGDTSDIEEYNDEDELDIENLDELLKNFPNNYVVSYYLHKLVNGKLLIHNFNKFRIMKI